MTTTSVPGELLGTRKSDEAYGAQRAGTSVLITNQLGKVLVQHVDYLATCLLPGGAVDKSESPAQAATRELEEKLGVTTTVDRCLAVDWVSPDSISAPTAMRFPGERRPLPARPGHRADLCLGPGHPRAGPRAVQLGPQRCRPTHRGPPGTGPAQAASRTPSAPHPHHRQRKHHLSCRKGGRPWLARAPDTMGSAQGV
ncbi:NUDIX domain-containing protein [Streptomyces lydicus]|uniref:NUDIX domain-containing protein n=1 Tax=Streptomyces lydicus TaxID=47763 RepID=UPI0037AD9461